MSKPKYLYIDDENDASVSSICSGFNDREIIEVKYLDIGVKQSFDSIKEKLLNEEFDGLILDLKLDGEGAYRLNFQAPTLAQDIHTLISSDHEKEAFPIILCSTDDKMKATYDKDKHSHALFDYKFLKGEEMNWGKFSNKLLSLANGYKQLNVKEKTIGAVLGREDLSQIDPRIIEKFIDPEEVHNFSSFDYAGFVIEGLFHHPGILINEYFLASRFGVDIVKSGDSWIKLKEILNEYCKYKGVFSDGWNRWWADKVNSYFKDISDGERLSMLNAEDRVKILSEKLSLEGLKVAEPLQYSSSSCFWTICEETKMPLDPLEGFKVYENKDLMSWQESKYVSFYAVKDQGLTRYGLRPRSSEMGRIELMVEILSEYEN